MELKPEHNIHILNTMFLLIVPYGIETQEYQKLHQSLQTFNRTLWN